MKPPKIFTSIASKIALASSLAIGGLTGAYDNFINFFDNDTKEINSLTNAFNVAAQASGIEHQKDVPLIAHLENSSNYYKNPDIVTHGIASTGILSGRLHSETEYADVPVYQLDVSPIRNTEATKEAFELGSVLTISSVGLNSAELASYDGAGNTFQKRMPYLAEVDGYDPEKFWDEKSDAVIVASVGNEGHTGLDKYISFLPIYEADATILVGSIKPNVDGTSRVAYYSSTTPDLVAFEGFDQGFELQDSTVDKEITHLYNKIASDSPPAELLDEVKSQNEQEAGTSFAAPDVGGYIAKSRLEHPNLHSNEVVAAAYLSTTEYTDGKEVSADYVKNAAGLPFDAGNAGHGAFLPEMFDDVMDAFAKHKTETGMETEFERIAAFGHPDGENGKSFNFLPEEGDMTVMRTIGYLSFKNDTKDPVESFPDKIEIESPDGTIYEVPLKMKSYDQHEVEAAASITAFLGEKAEGEWKIRVPDGYELTDSELTHVGAKNHGANAISWMIDYSTDYKNQQQQPILPELDSSAWDKSNEQVSNSLNQPTPGP